MSVLVTVKELHLGHVLLLAFRHQIEKDFSLIACLFSSVMGSVWFLDSGVSFHMTGDKDLFSYLEEKDLGVHIEMGDDGRYGATGIRTSFL